MLITSNQNPAVKEIKSLKNKKYREEKGQYFIEGIRFVEEALKEKAVINSIVVSENLNNVKGGEEILEKVKGLKVPVYTVRDKIFKDISDTENPQGIMAVVKMTASSLEEILRKGSLIIVMDAIQDPGNMGTIIRTADAAGVTGIIVSKGCVDTYNPKVLRSTMGSIFHVNIHNTEDLSETINKIKERGITVLAAHLQGEANYFEQDMKRDCAIIIGNEANGISDDAAQQADVLVKIPMPGKSESLNASVAAGLLMYEAVRQRLCIK